MLMKLPLLCCFSCFGDVVPYIGKHIYIYIYRWIKNELNHWTHCCMSNYEERGIRKRANLIILDDESLDFVKETLWAIVMGQTWDVFAPQPRWSPAALLERGDENRWLACCNPGGGGIYQRMSPPLNFLRRSSGDLLDISLPTRIWGDIQHPTTINGVV